MNKIETFLKKLFSVMLEQPDKCRVGVAEYLNTFKVSLDIDNVDYGKVIGQKGLHFKNLNRLLNYLGLEKDVIIEFLPPQEGERMKFKREFEPKDFNLFEVQDAIEDCVKSLLVNSFKLEAVHHGHNTTFIIKPSEGEDLERLSKIVQLLEPLVYAIGRTKGRLLSLDAKKIDSASLESSYLPIPQNGASAPTTETI